MICTVNWYAGPVSCSKRNRRYRKKMKQRQRMPIRLTDRPARDFRRAGTGTASLSLPHAACSGSHAKQKPVLLYAPLKPAPEYDQPVRFTGSISGFRGSVFPFQLPVPETIQGSASGLSFFGIFLPACAPSGGMFQAPDRDFLYGPVALPRNQGMLSALTGPRSAPASPWAMLDRPRGCLYNAPVADKE